MTRPGTLYGIGVGPGDPELLPLKSARILSGVKTVFAARSTKNEDSLALSIARPHLAPEADVRTLGFPMTRDSEELNRAWEENARQVLDALELGDAAFLTLGDTMTYSTFTYLMTAMRTLSPQVDIEAVPGITSYQTAAAMTLTPLVESGQTLALVPGIRDEADLEKLLDATDNAVILKAYRNLPRLRALVERKGRKATFATRLGLDGEHICDVREAADSPNYFSMLLVTHQ